MCSDRYAIRTRNLQDWNLTRYRCANRSKAPTTDAVAVHRDLRVARKSDILNDAAALALVLDARRGTLDADRAATQAHLAADLLVDEGLTARQGRHAEFETEPLDATEELALARRPNALGAIGVQTQVAAEAPVDEDEVRPARGGDRGDRARVNIFSARLSTRPRLAPCLQLSLKAKPLDREARGS